jgi:hypothetical protein
VSKPCAQIPAGLSGYDAMTAHVRLAPFRRRFAYKLAQVLIDVDAPEAAARGLRLFRVNRFGLFSFFERDHGDRSGAPLRGWAQAAFAQAGLDLDGGPIRLLTFPRVLGFVFNPISVFFGYGPDGRLRGVIYEVNNTFGETHAYVAAAQGGPVEAHAAPKRFHVSPFMDVHGDYHFRLCAPGEKFYLFVENKIEGQPAHYASLIGRRRTVSDGWLMSVFFRLPLMTLQVVAGIHWEALWIWLRGAGYRDKPSPPKAAVTPATSSANAMLAEGNTGG